MLGSYVSYALEGDMHQDLHVRAQVLRNKTQNKFISLESSFSPPVIRSPKDVLMCLVLENGKEIECNKTWCMTLGVHYNIPKAKTRKLNRFSTSRSSHMQTQMLTLKKIVF